MWVRGRLWSEAAPVPHPGWCLSEPQLCTLCQLRPRAPAEEPTQLGRAWRDLFPPGGEWGTPQAMAGAEQGLCGPRTLRGLEPGFCPRSENETGVSHSLAPRCGLQIPRPGMALTHFKDGKMRLQVVRDLPRDRGSLWHGVGGQFQGLGRLPSQMSLAVYLPALRGCGLFCPCRLRYMRTF